MSFFGKSFIFDGKSSEEYNLYISSSDGENARLTGAGDVELITQKVFRRNSPYLLGVTPSPVLQFDIEITSPLEIMADEMGYIMSWIFGQTEYKKLQIVQEDMYNFYYNCFITSPKVIKVGNKTIGFSGTVICDKPFATMYPKTLTKTYSTFPVTTGNTFTFNNISQNNFYEYPTISFTLGGGGTTATITNNTDGGRQFIFTGLTAGETITVNNDLCIITSSLTLNRLSAFNKNWFRLLKGSNSITITGYPASVTFTYSPAVKIGG